MPVYSTVRSQILSRDVRILAQFWNRRDFQIQHVPAQWGSDSCLDRASAGSPGHWPVWRHSLTTCPCGSLQIWNYSAGLGFFSMLLGFYCQSHCRVHPFTQTSTRGGIWMEMACTYFNVGFWFCFVFFTSTKFIKFEIYAHLQCLVLNTEITPLPRKETVPEMSCHFHSLQSTVPSSKAQTSMGLPLQCSVVQKSSKTAVAFSLHCYSNSNLLLQHQWTPFNWYFL